MLDRPLAKIWGAQNNAEGLLPAKPSGFRSHLQKTFVVGVATLSVLAVLEAPLFLVGCALGFFALEVCRLVVCGILEYRVFKIMARLVYWRLHSIDADLEALKEEHGDRWTFEVFSERQRRLWSALGMGRDEVCTGRNPTRVSESSCPLPLTAGNSE